MRVQGLRRGWGAARGDLVVSMNLARMIYKRIASAYIGIDSCQGRYIEVGIVVKEMEPTLRGRLSHRSV